MTGPGAPKDRGGETPCFAEDIVGGHAVDPETRRDVARFRRAAREELRATRALSSEARKTATQALCDLLRDAAPVHPGQRIAVYWPIRGEPDLRGWMRDAVAAGAEVLLPVVVEKNAPLVFRQWQPGCAMTRGLWNIPVPADGAEALPDLVISPLLGADPAGFRLGNGGGYYDRTLAALPRRPRVLGVGFAGCLIPTIYPQPWDVPMDALLLSDGTRIIRESETKTPQRP